MHGSQRTNSMYMRENDFEILLSYTAQREAMDMFLNKLHFGDTAEWECAMCLEKSEQVMG